jgi:hypothetical protein
MTTKTFSVQTTPARRWWIRITWLLTWWIPSFLLSSIGGMKRADVRMAWREKLAIFMMIIGMCGIVLFYIIGFGLLLCPDSDKAWNPTELLQHAGTNDYYAAIAGKVYDVSACNGRLSYSSHCSLPVSTRATTAISRRTVLAPPSCWNLPAKTSPITSPRP